MSSEFIIFLEPARDGMVDSPTPEEAEAVQRHFEYLKRLTDDGVVTLAGRTTEPPFAGIVVLQSDGRESVEAIVTDDPAVKAGVFSARLSPFHTALSRG